jgi:hypothetical protein
MGPVLSPCACRPTTAPLADQRGLGQPLAQVQAGGKQPRDHALVRSFGEQDLELADDLAVMP